MNCAPIISLLDAHVRGSQQRSKPGGRTLVHVVRSMKRPGLGDQLTAFLGSMALAVATGRRLEIAPQPFSYVHVAFQLPFDTNYSGDTSWLLASLSPSALRGGGLGNHSVIINGIHTMGAIAFENTKDAMAFDLCLSKETIRRARTFNNTKRVSKALDRIAFRWERHLYRNKWSYGTRRGHGLTTTHCQARLAAMTNWTGDASPLDQTVELFAAGNAGSVIFKKLMTTELTGWYNNMYPACALRHWLRPTADVAAARERLRPWAAGLDSSVRGQQTIGIHIRANAFLAAKRSGHDEQKFSAMGDSVKDTDLGASCKQKAARMAGGATQVQHNAVDFNEFWLTALELESAMTTVTALYRTALVSPKVRWFLVTDSVSLKRSALQLCGSQLVVTDITPSHIYCIEDEVVKLRASIIETVSELLLLAECDVLVHARSRFPLAALYLGERFRQAASISVEMRPCLRCADVYSREDQPGPSGIFISEALRPYFSRQDWGGYLFPHQLPKANADPRRVLEMARDWCDTFRKRKYTCLSMDAAAPFSLWERLSINESLNLSKLVERAGFFTVNMELRAAPDPQVLRKIEEVQARGFPPSELSAALHARWASVPFSKAVGPPDGF